MHQLELHRSLLREFDAAVKATKLPGTALGMVGRPFVFSCSTSTEQCIIGGAIASLSMDNKRRLTLLMSGQPELMGKPVVRFTHTGIDWGAEVDNDGTPKYYYGTLSFG